MYNISLVSISATAIFHSKHCTNVARAQHSVIHRVAATEFDVRAQASETDTERVSFCSLLNWKSCLRAAICYVCTYMHVAVYCVSATGGWGCKHAPCTSLSHHIDQNYHFCVYATERKQKQHHRILLFVSQFVAALFRLSWAATVSQ